MYDILELNKKLLAELRDIAKDLKIKRVESFKKQDLIYKILDTQAIVVSENKAAKKEAPRTDGAKNEKQPAASEASGPSNKKRPGRPKKDKKKDPEPVPAGAKAGELRSEQGMPKGMAEAGDRPEPDQERPSYKKDGGRRDFRDRGDRKDRSDRVVFESAPGGTRRYFRIDSVLAC